MTFSYLHPEQVGQTQQQAPQNLTWSIHSFVVQAEIRGISSYKLCR